MEVFEKAVFCVLEGECYLCIFRVKYNDRLARINMKRYLGFSLLLLLLLLLLLILLLILLIVFI